MVFSCYRLHILYKPFPFCMYVGVFYLVPPGSAVNLRILENTTNMFFTGRLPDLLLSIGESLFLPLALFNKLSFCSVPQVLPHSFYFFHSSLWLPNRIYFGAGAALYQISFFLWFLCRSSFRCFFAPYTSTSNSGVTWTIFLAISPIKRMQTKHAKSSHEHRI